MSEHDSGLEFFSGTFSEVFESFSSGLGQNTVRDEQKEQPNVLSDTATAGAEAAVDSSVERLGELTAKGLKSGLKGIDVGAAALDILSSPPSVGRVESSSKWAVSREKLVEAYENAGLHAMAEDARNPSVTDLGIWTHVTNTRVLLREQIENLKPNLPPLEVPVLPGLEQIIGFFAGSRQSVSHTSPEQNENPYASSVKVIERSDGSTVTTTTFSTSGDNGPHPGPGQLGNERTTQTHTEYASGSSSTTTNYSNGSKTQTSVDKDGNGTHTATTSSGYSVTYTQSNHGAEIPILLDLSGSGIEITELSQSTVFMDATGDGLLNRTAWAAEGNGVLFYDPDNTGEISEKRQYVFTEWDPTATSDIEALRSVFDSNGDGVFDATARSCQLQGDGDECRWLACHAVVGGVGHHYRVEVMALEAELAKLEGQEMLAGMPVEAYLRTEDRTPLSYLTKPLTDYFERYESGFK